RPCQQADGASPHGSEYGQRSAGAARRLNSAASWASRGRLAITSSCAIKVPSRVSKTRMSLTGNKKFFGARRETFDFPQRGQELRAQLVRQARLRLAQCQRLRQEAQLLAMPRIEPLPQAALALCVSPQPLLAGYFRPPAGWLQDRLLLLGFRRNHVRWGRISSPAASHGTRITGRKTILTHHYPAASNFSQLICPSGSTRPVTRSLRVSNTRPPQRS